MDVYLGLLETICVKFDLKEEEYLISLLVLGLQIFFGLLWRVQLSE